MKIIYRQGDLLKTTAGIIAHGCNAQGVMGSGVAKLIREAHPRAYTTYRDAFERGGLKPGMVVLAEGSFGKMIANAITQEHYGRNPHRVYVDYQAISDVMNYLSRRAPMYVGEGGEVAMPMIGAGLANGDWKVIEAIIEEELIRVQPVVYHLGAKPGEELL